MVHIQKYLCSSASHLYRSISPRYERTIILCCSYDKLIRIQYDFDESSTLT